MTLGEFIKRLNMVGLKLGTSGGLDASSIASGTIDPDRMPYQPSRNVDALSQSFQYIDHRGMGGVFPEETMDAYRKSVAIGARYIECDCHKMRDGTLAIMHDSTIDRTTSSSGNTADLTQLEYQKLVVDCSSWFGGGYSDTVPPSFDDICIEFGNRVVLIPEAKNTGSGAVIVTTLEKYGVSRDMAIVQSFIAGELTAAMASGYPTMFLIGTYTGTPSAAALVASGYEWIGIGRGSSTASADACRAAGLKVAVYTIDRKIDCEGWLSHCDAIWSDQSGYLRGDLRLTTDPFASQTFYPGHMAGNTNGTQSGKGAFYSPDLWGNDLSGSNIFNSMLMGWANPLANPTSMTITFSVKFESAFSADRFAGIAILASDRAWADDIASVNAYGYHFFIRKNGELYINRYDGNTNTNLVGKSTGVSAIADGATATFKITVTATHLTLERTDVAYSTGPVASATYRGSYMHASIKGVFAKFKDIVIA